MSITGDIHQSVSSFSSSFAMSVIWIAKKTESGIFWAGKAGDETMKRRVKN